MKTTLELPDELFRPANARAAQEGISLHEYVVAALREKLGHISERSGERLRMKHFGSLAHVRKNAWVTPATKSLAAVNIPYIELNCLAWDSVMESPPSHPGERYGHR